MTSDLTGMVLGYGSVGRRHADVLSKLARDLIIVETNPAARAAATIAHPLARVAERPEALDGQIDWGETMAVIATWGPSHADLFHTLADRGVSRILCEKPMAASAWDARRMVERAVLEKITLGVHHYIRWAGLASSLRLVIAEYGLGKPVGMVAQGGAACLLTNGIHWLDFATELFGSDPARVVSTARGEKINPRSSDLGLYDGTAVWSFPEGREATISFTNRSSIALEARVLFRDACADIDSDLNVGIRRRDPEAVKRFPAVTRTGPATELLFQGALPGVRGYYDGIREALESVGRRDAGTCTGHTGAAAVQGCIAALLSAQEGRAVELPLVTDTEWERKRWPIS